MAMSPKIRVLIVDDHPVFRQGLRQVVEADSRFELVAEAGDGETALRSIQDKSPDVAVLDVDLPRLSGLEVARALQGKGLPTRVIILTMYKEEEIFNRALDFGVTGFVLDRRNYRTVPAREGYAQWAATYEDTIKR